MYLIHHYNIIKIHFTTQMGFAAGTAKTQQEAYKFRKAGSPVYRVTVAKEIREALKALPNDRITDVTVEAITRGGHVLNQKVTSSSSDETLTFAAALTSRTLQLGDIIRYGDEYRAVKTVASATAVTIDEAMGSLTRATVYKQNGMKYDITFEQGCRTHEDCRYNGVDENDSDGPAQQVLYEGGDNNAAYCHNGGTCMCTDGFYGPGCTATGRGHHANAKVTVSGDVYNLKCDGTVKQENGVTQGLTASHSAFVLDTAGVARTDPLKVTLSASVGDNDQVSGNDIIEGDHIRIENQVRTVVKVAAAVVHVDQPFEEIATSDHTLIFPKYTPVEVIHDMGGVRSSCTVTDLRQLTSTNQVCHYAAGTTTDVRGCGYYYANQASNGNVDQVMRELNSATPGDITTVTHTVVAGDTLTHTAGSNVYASVPTLPNTVVVGMGVMFKVTVTGPTVTYIDGGTLTERTNNNAFKTSLNGGAGVESAKWADALCTGTACQIIFTKESNKDGPMDEREVEIGDRIRVLTDLGSWETRTVDSVTYSSYQISGFVVSEPYEEGSVSKTVSKAASTIAATTFKYTLNNHGVTSCVAGDFCRVTGGTLSSSDGVYKVASVETNTITFDSAFGLPAQQASQSITLTKAHLAYNDGAGTTEAKSCSGRGLCDDSSGECQCFKGYTGVDCSIQNALAV